MGPGTLYPIFAGLTEAGFLRVDPIVVEGKVRKNYSITSSGPKALADFKEKIRELVSEALYGEAEPHVKSKARRRVGNRAPSKART